MNRNFVYNYLTRREESLPVSGQDALREEIFTLKKEALSKIRKLLELAVINLEKNGCKVLVVKDAKEARAKVLELIGPAGKAVKSKSNTLDKLKLSDSVDLDLEETDLGAYIVSKIGGESGHPVLPAIEWKAGDIAKAFKEKRGLDLPLDAQSMVGKLKEIIREKIDQAEVGLTGANAITANGEIVILENEGNAGLVARLNKKHIVVAGIEKIIENIEGAMKIVKAASVFGTGQSWPTYVNIINGPSKTADIENELISGVHGPTEVVVVLIEGKVYEKLGSNLESMLYCIHCGACYDLCPSWNMSSVMPKVSDFEKNFKYCSLCQNCTFNCPAKIDWQNITRIYREKFEQAGQTTVANQDMIENIRKYGNPFGETVDSQTPDKLFCC
ncbi:MAG: LUD domain-containing protein [Patescibacteria group bacterium]